MTPEKQFGITLKQKRFIDNYMVMANKKQAAIAAGYSERSAHATAWQEFNKPSVKAYYEHLIAQTTAKSSENISWVLSRLMEIAGADINDFVDKEGNLKELGHKKVNGRLINGLRHTRTGIDVTLSSREKALELLGRYFSMWSDKLDVTTQGQALRELNIIFKDKEKKK